MLMAKSYIIRWMRTVFFKLIVRAVRKYYPEGMYYDQAYRMYAFRWTKELDDQLFGGEKV